MKLPAPPIVSEVELGPLSKNARKHFTALRHYGEMWKAEAVRRGGEITRLLTRDVEREKEMIVLRERNSKLETQHRQNSNNSSKQPSSDPLHKVRKMLDRIQSKKKTGDQPGHERQQILPTKDVRQVIPEQCSDCQGPLRGKDPKPSFHQQIELPTVKPMVTLILVHQLTCRRCGKVTRGEVPAKYLSRYGSRLEALVSYLTGAYRFSKRKIMSLLREFFGIAISLGMVCKLQTRTTKALEPGMVEIDDKIMDALISLNVDETGIRFEGKLAYIWVAVCKWAMKYLIGPRSRLSFDRLVGKPLGVIYSDWYPVNSHLG
jgi:transposase